MEHKLFKPQSFEEGRHEVVGDCNGFSMRERWEKETPLFAEAILRNAVAGYGKPELRILDYGCGVGRLAKEIIGQSPRCLLTGTDASIQMLQQAKIYVNSDRFDVCLPHLIGIKNFQPRKYDLVYCVYVLQHAPAIEIRDILERIHSHLTDDGVFVYCSSDYRMAIRFDEPGFFDDRFLGVDLRREIERFFAPVGELFTPEEYKANPILDKMVHSGLEHPALIYRKKAVLSYVNAGFEEITENALPPASTPLKPIEKSYPEGGPEVFDGKTRLLLLNRLSPGDILVMSAAIRDLQLTYPDRFLIEVRSPCNDIFINNPRLTKLDYNESMYQAFNKVCSNLPKEDMEISHRTEIIQDKQGHDILMIDMHYPLLHSSGLAGYHFADGYRDWLESVLRECMDFIIKINPPQGASLYPEIFLDQNEAGWIGPVAVKKGYSGKYWLMNAGSKNDFPLKQYHRYQEVVDQLKAKDIMVVQAGVKGHNHKPLSGVIDMVGETNNLREFIRLLYHAEGLITCVSFPMHAAAALRKPCVVVAGAREGTRWELYPDHRFLYVNGTLPCAPYDGCWRSKIDECNNKVLGVPRCLDIITPEEIVRSVELYYMGGILKQEVRDEQLKVG